ncbi:hypothetical protein Avbf_17113, partial [Armadillidium vulgare]
MSVDFNFFPNSAFISLCVGILILNNNNNNFVNCQGGGKPNRVAIFYFQIQEGEAQIGSIFEHVLPLACFICTKRNCIGGKISGFCKMRERVEIPMYNNMIEFGVSGIHFPERGFIEIRINNLCFLE